MIVCSFLGHMSVYDKDIERKISEAIYKLVETNDDVEFLICDQSKEYEFYNFCLAAVLDAKNHYYKKNITITFVIKEEEKDRFITELKQGDTRIPPCVIDNIKSVPILPSPKNKRNFIIVKKRIIHWMIQCSTHLISYIYFPLLLPENQDFLYAKKRDLTILDLTDSDTHSYILNIIDGFPKKEQFIFRNVIAGKTQKEIIALLDVSGYSFRETVAHISRKLEINLNKRLLESFKEGKPFPITCGIFAMGEITYESLWLFEQALMFIISRYNITQFYVNLECYYSGYIGSLKRLLKIYGYHDIHICLVIDENENKELEKDNQYFAPPYHSVKSIKTYEKDKFKISIKKMEMIAEESDFCICNLSNDSFSDNVRNVITKAKGVKVLDIAKLYNGNE